MLLLGDDADAGARASRPAQWTPRERRELVVVAGRRLGQRAPMKKPPSPDPNGWKTMVKPLSPPPPSSIY